MLKGELGKPTMYQMLMAAIIEEAKWIAGYITKYQIHDFDWDKEMAKIHQANMSKFVHSLEDAQLSKSELEAKGKQGTICQYEVNRLPIWCVKDDKGKILKGIHFQAAIVEGEEIDIAADKKAAEEANEQQEL
jgi:hypothetical protein